MEAKQAPHDGRVAVVTAGRGASAGRPSRRWSPTAAGPCSSIATRRRSPSPAERLAERGVDHHAATLDVTDEAAVERAMAVVVARYGRLDILVNNAGIALRKPTLELTLADWEKVVDVNLDAVFLCARAAGRTMVARAAARSSTSRR
jgi:NAD(P)-dependent dehydrogenase (short-subunit alcohol dehydrogenase family)